MRDHVGPTPETLRHARDVSKQSYTTPDGAIVLLRGDCMQVLPALAGLEIDAVISDPPYGCTDNKWDRMPPLLRWWKVLRTVAKASAVYALFCQQPFTTHLISTCRSLWRYELIWHKPRPTNFLNANKMPLRAHEAIQIFCAAPSAATYYPQMKKGEPYKATIHAPSANYRPVKSHVGQDNQGTRHPRSVLTFANPVHKGGHPTQKPIALMEWLVRTYTKPGDLVLDPYMGSGTTGEACRRNGRRFVGIEREAKYFDMCVARFAA